MSTIKQIEQARINGAKSNGPITPQGKHAVSRNALKHGLLASAVVLRWEDQELFDSFLQSFLEMEQPANDAEFLLVEEIVAAKWRLRRAWSIENRLLSVKTDEMKSETDEKYEDLDIASRVAIAFREASDRSTALDKVNRHCARLRREAAESARSLREAQQRRRENEKLQNKPESPQKETIPG